MPDTQNIETAAAAPEHDQASDVRTPKPSTRAAAVEAAYILEAVRR